MIVHVTFSKMPSLQFLQLNYNYIRKLDPTIFHGINMFVLDLSNNMLLETKFIGHIDSEWATRLDLSNNPIISLENVNVVVQEMQLKNSSLTNCSIGNMFRNLIITNGILKTVDLLEATGLLFLNLSSNHLTHFEFKDPQNLYTIDLSNNSLRMVHLEHAQRLERMFLSRNDFRSTLNVSLPSSLQELDLSHNKIADLYLPKHLANLKHLNLAHCELHALNADLFLPTAMETMDLSYNILVYLDMKIFNGLNELLTLFLNGNRLADLNVEEYQGTAQLAISDNAWNCIRLKSIINSNVIDLNSRIQALRLCQSFLRLMQYSSRPTNLLP